MVFQSYALFPHMTVLENVCYGPLSMRMTRRRRASSRTRSSRCSGLPGSASACRPSSPAASSSASRWRARSCSSRRCCCSTSRCRTSTRSCAAACGRRSASCSSRSTLTVIYVTHDQEEALAVSDHIIVMEGGQDRAAGHAARALRVAGEPLSSPTSSATPISSTASSRRRRTARVFAAGGARMPRARGRHRAGTRHARGAAAPVAHRRRRRPGTAAGRMQARGLPGQPHRVRGRNAVGRAARVRRRRRARRARATRRSASRSTRTRRSCCGASAQDGWRHGASRVGAARCGPHALLRRSLGLRRPRPCSRIF